MTETITLTRTEAERLIECYGLDEPLDEAVELLTMTPLPTVVYGVCVRGHDAWPERHEIHVAQDVLDRLIYGETIAQSRSSRLEVIIEPSTGDWKACFVTATSSRTCSCGRPIPSGGPGRPRQYCTTCRPPGMSRTRKPERPCRCGCGVTIPAGGKRVYATDACKRRSYRARSTSLASP